VLKGLRRGAKLYAVDPRRTSSAQWADLWLGIDVGTDIALANAMGREILEAGLENRNFIENATTGFEEYRRTVESYTLERAEKLTSVPRASIRELAHAYAKADRAQLCWTLGITEHHNATDNVFALINLSLLTGHVGRWGSGLAPLRGQNNVQGGGDMGAIPNRFPGFQEVANPEYRAKFEKAWSGAIFDVSTSSERTRRNRRRTRSGQTSSWKDSTTSSSRTSFSPGPQKWPTWFYPRPPPGRNATER